MIECWHDEDHTAASEEEAKAQGWIRRRIQKMDGAFFVWRCAACAKRHEEEKR